VSPGSYSPRARREGYESSEEAKRAGRRGGAGGGEEEPEHEERGRSTWTGLTSRAIGVTRHKDQKPDIQWAGLYGSGGDDLKYGFEPEVCSLSDPIPPVHRAPTAPHVVLGRQRLTRRSRSTQ
jgi:hypothetical protein